MLLNHCGKVSGVEEVSVAKIDTKNVVAMTEVDLVTERGVDMMTATGTVAGAEMIETVLEVTMNMNVEVI